MEVRNQYHIGKSTSRIWNCSFVSS